MVKTGNRDLLKLADKKAVLHDFKTLLMYLNLCPSIG